MSSPSSAQLRWKYSGMLLQEWGGGEKPRKSDEKQMGTIYKALSLIPGKPISLDFTVSAFHTHIYTHTPWLCSWHRNGRAHLSHLKETNGIWLDQSLSSSLACFVLSCNMVASVVALWFMQRQPCSMASTNLAHGDLISKLLWNLGLTCGNPGCFFCKYYL